MKKLITLSLSTAIAVTGFAQNRMATRAAGANFSQPATTTANKTTGVTGIVTPGFLQDTSCHFSLYYAGSDASGGYLAGNNQYGDKEKMMRYSLAAVGAAMPASVDTIYALFGLKYLAGNANVYGKVYADDGTGAPGALLGTSMAVSVANLDTTGYTKFGFATPVNLTTDKFFLSIDISALYATADTAVILTSDDCAAVDSNAAWDKFSDNTFVREGADNNWGTNLEYLIAGRITAESAGVATIGAGRFATRCYPNPAASNLQVAFAAKAGSPASITLRDITGKVVATQSITAKTQNNVVFHVSALRSGLYFCEVSSNGATETVKVSVQ